MLVKKKNITHIAGFVFRVCAVCSVCLGVSGAFLRRGNAGI